MKHVVDYADFSSIDSPNGKEAKKLNNPYNWSAVPDENRYDIPHYPDKETFQIEIGDPDPITKFRKWNKNYWETEYYKKKREKRQQKGETDNNARVEP